ncbi:cytochrome c oxidase subunit VII domain-containing protein [Sarocladium implicatum]|nr:cytochrome c oxidase subunit VII domain-containing protein [Sarocladium implicatum]
MGLVDAKNPVPERQRAYQAAYKAHTRLWKIGPRSQWYMMPFQVVLWGTVAATMYSGGRKVLGHNTWW